MAMRTNLNDEKMVKDLFFQEERQAKIKDSLASELKIWFDMDIENDDVKIEELKINAITKVSKVVGIDRNDVEMRAMAEIIFEAEGKKFKVGTTAEIKNEVDKEPMMSCIKTEAVEELV